MIVAVSLAQVAAGVACWCAALEPDAGRFGLDPEVGRFGLAACLAVGGLGLIGQGSTFLRPAAVGANALLAAVFVPGFLDRVVIRVVVWTGASLPAGVDTVVMTDLFAAGMVFSAAASAYGLWRLSAARAIVRAESGAAAAGGGTTAP